MSGYSNTPLIHHLHMAVRVPNMTSKPPYLLFICIGVLLILSYLTPLYETLVLNVVFEEYLGQKATYLPTPSSRLLYTFKSILSIHSILPLANCFIIFSISYLYLKRVLNISLKKVLLNRNNLLKVFILCIFIYLFYRLFSISLSHFCLKFVFSIYKSPWAGFMTEIPSYIRMSFFDFSSILSHPIESIVVFSFKLFQFISTDLFFIVVVVEELSRRYDEYKTALYASTIRAVFLMLFYLPFVFLVLFETYKSMLNQSDKSILLYLSLIHI